MEDEKKIKKNNQFETKEKRLYEREEQEVTYQIFNTPIGGV